MLRNNTKNENYMHITDAGSLTAVFNKLRTFIGSFMVVTTNGSRLIPVYCHSKYD